jgi:hypothetical protein
MGAPALKTVAPRCDSSEVVSSQPSVGLHWSGLCTGKTVQAWISTANPWVEDTGFRMLI